MQTQAGPMFDFHLPGLRCKLTTWQHWTPGCCCPSTTWENKHVGQTSTNSRWSYSWWFKYITWMLKFYHSLFRCWQYWGGELFANIWWECGALSRSLLFGAGESDSDILYHITLIKIFSKYYFRKIFLSSCLMQCIEHESIQRRWVEQK